MNQENSGVDANVAEGIYNTGNLLLTLMAVTATFGGLLMTAASAWWIKILVGLAIYLYLAVLCTFFKRYVTGKLQKIS